MRKIDYLIALVITVICFAVRLYKIDNPIADQHSFRQADTASVARNFIKEGYNPLFPQSDSFTALSETQIPNPNRYFINEFPFYNSIVALVYHFKGIDPVYARLVSIFFASLGTFFLYLIGKKLFSTKVAALAALFYAVFPTTSTMVASSCRTQPLFVFPLFRFMLLLRFVDKPNYPKRHIYFLLPLPLPCSSNPTPFSFLFPSFTG